MKRYVFFLMLFLTSPVYASNNISLSNFNNTNISSEWLNAISVFKKHYNNIKSFNIQCTKIYCRSLSKNNFFYLKLKNNGTMKYKFKSFKIKYIVVNLQKFSKIYKGNNYRWSINNSINVSSLRTNKDTIYEKHNISISGENIKNMSTFLNYFTTNRFAIKYNKLNYKCLKNVCYWKINGSLDVSQSH